MKPIIFLAMNDTLELKTKSKLFRENIPGYVLYFSGIDKRMYAVAHIESITKDEYVALNNKGLCFIPACFNLSDELKISLIQVDSEGIEQNTESVWLRFE